MHFPIWISIVYFAVAGLFLLMAGVLYRANPGRGINQSAGLLIALCGLWQFASGLIYVEADSAVTYIRIAVSLHGVGVASILTLLAALQHPQDILGRLLARTKWAWAAGMVYALPTYSPWFIPYESTPEDPLFGALWYPYAIAQVVGGGIVLGATLRAAVTLRGAARFTAQIICGGSGVLFALMGLRSVARLWVPAELLVFSNAIAGLLIFGTVGYAVLTRRVFRARDVTVGWLFQLLSLALAVGVAWGVLWGGRSRGMDRGWLDFAALGAAMAVWTVGNLWRRRRAEREAHELGGRLMERLEDVWRREREHEGDLSALLDELLEWTGAQCGRILLRDGQTWRDGDVSLRNDDPLMVHLQRHYWATTESIARSWLPSNHAALAGVSLERLGGVLAILSTRRKSRRPAMLVLGEKANRELYSHREITTLHALLDVVEGTLESRDAGRRGRALGRIEALEMLGASIGHDFKQHLAAVRVLAYRLSERKLSAAASEDYLSKVSLELDRLGEYARKLMKLSRWAPAERESVNLVELLEDVAASLRDLAVSHGVEVEIGFPDRMATVWAVRSRLQQALVNLGVNAIEAMKRGSAPAVGRRLEIAVRRGSEGLSIEVADNGPGLPAEVLARLFDPFVTDGKSEGDGLGLYLAWDAVTREGGFIRYEPNVSSGSRFVVGLPD